METFAEDFLHMSRSVAARLWSFAQVCWNLSLFLVIIFCSWLRKLGLNEGKVQRLHSHVGDSIHQVQSKICAVQWEPHKIRESGRKDFVFRSFFPLGDTEDVFETVKVGRLRVEKVLWPWHEDVWIQALPVSLKLYLFHVRYFIFCDICDILYSCDICDILYSWPQAICNVSLLKTTIFFNTVYCHISHIVYMLYCIMCI